MTKLARSTTIRCLFFGVLVLAPNSWAQKRPPTLEQLAKTYGLDSYGQIEAIRYTWNGQLPGVNISHSWDWKAKTNKFSYEGKDNAGKLVQATSMRSELPSPPEAANNQAAP